MANETPHVDPEDGRPPDARVRLSDLDIAFSVLERVRDQVRRDVESRLKTDATDRVYAAVLEQLAEKGQLESMIATEFGRRARVVFSLVGGAAVVLGFLGFQSVLPALESRAADAAAETISEEFARYRDDSEELRRLIRESESSLSWTSSGSAASRRESTSTSSRQPPSAILTLGDYKKSWRLCSTVSRRHALIRSRRSQSEALVVRPENTCALWASWQN